jgi:hypothetical protein
VLGAVLTILAVRRRGTPIEPEQARRPSG